MIKIIKHFKSLNFPIDIFKIGINSTSSFYKKIYFFNTNKFSFNSKEQINRLNCPNINLEENYQREMMDCFHRISKNYEKINKPKLEKIKNNNLNKLKYDFLKEEEINFIDIKENSDVNKRI
jgi:hypothetical protein